MQILINIPDEQIEKSLAESKYIHENEGEKGSVNIVLLYTNKKLEFVDIVRKTDYYSLTDKYTVLPKGHGRLFDERDIVNGNYEVIGNRIYELEPIIESDTEESNTDNKSDDELYADAIDAFKVYATGRKRGIRNEKH